MNKLFFLKALITVMTLLIFLGTGGVIYGLFFYKKPPKTLSRPAPVSASAPADVWLDQGKRAEIKEITGCGAFLCLRVATQTEAEKIAVVDPVARKVLFWIRAGSKPE